MSSSTETLSVVKDNSFCLIEGIKDGFNWPLLAQDMLLRSAIKNEKYGKIIIISFERLLSDVSGCITRNSSINNKVSIIDGMGLLAQKISLDSILQQVSCTCDVFFDGAVKEKQKQTDQGNEGNARNNNNENNNKSDNNNNSNSENAFVGIFVYSLSSLEMSVGKRKSHAFLQSLFKLLIRPVSTTPLDSHSHISNDGHAKSVESRRLGCVFSSLYSNLQSSQDIYGYKALADVYCLIHANEGQYSTTVAAEIHTVRRSTSSITNIDTPMNVAGSVGSVAGGGVGGSAGKISECTEWLYFDEKGLDKGGDRQWGHAALLPIIKQGCSNITVIGSHPNTAKAGSDNGRDGQEGGGAGISSIVGSKIDEDYSDSHVLHEMIDKINPHAADTSSTRSSYDNTDLEKHVVTNKRLIEFDSTDPDFDEDSDPDADLDL